MLALVLVAVSLGLSNFAAAIGIGVSGVSSRTRLEVGVIFGLFETGMPLIGLAAGHQIASALGQETRLLGGGLLIAAGLYGLLAGVRRGGRAVPLGRGKATGRLLLSGLALSVDNLAVGFALGTYHVSVVIAAVIIGAVSVALSLLGLELGSRGGTRLGVRGELPGALILVAVGIAIASGVL
jgi:putative Mn2+ efflux pump MntP